MKQVKIVVSGKVQGVCFRHYTREEAQKLNLIGYVKNLANGNVEIVAQGENSAVDRLITWAGVGSPSAQVKDVNWELVNNDDRQEFSNFSVRY